MNQAQKDKYCIISLIREIKKDTDLRGIEHRTLYQRPGRVAGGRNREGRSKDPKLVRQE